MTDETTLADVLKAVEALRTEVGALQKEVGKLRKDFNQYRDEMNENWRRQASFNEAHIENMKRVAGALSVRMKPYPREAVAQNLGRQKHG